MANFRILHVSDLHARASAQFDESTIVDKMLADVATVHRERAVDLIVFSGDLAYSGKSIEFQLGRTLLLDPVMKAVGLNAEHVILTPGNHDVDRDGVDKVDEAGLAATLTDRDNTVAMQGDANLVERAMQRLAAWTHFSEGFYSGVDRREVISGGWTRIIEIGESALGVAALNSTWRSAGLGDSERHKLIVGERQVSEALGRIRHCDIRLVVAHHPLEWLVEFDSRMVRTEIEGAGAIFLTGHDHEPDPTHSISTHGSAVYSRGGCMYSGASFANSYSVVDLDLGRGRGRIRTRMWLPMRRTFGSVTEGDGGLEFDLPMPQGDALPAVAHEDVTRSLVEIVQRTSVVADLVADARYSTVGELVVPPRFYPAPYADLYAASRASGEGKVERIDGLTVLGAQRVTVVAGEPQAGVSVALAWLLERRHSSNRSQVPLLIRFSARQGKKVIDQDLHEAARRAGAKVGWEDPLPPALIAVDDVVLENESAVGRLVTHVLAHPEHGYLLGCHGANHVAVARAFRDADLEVSVIHLGPLGRRELRALAHKVVPGASAELVDTIMRVLGENNLPRDPFLMAALIAVLHDRQDASALSATVILDRYVDLLLGRAEIAGAQFMEFRHRELVLEHVAGHLARKRIWSLPCGDLEDLVGTFLRERGEHKVSAGRVIQELVDRRLLAIEDGVASFRHPALQALLAARFTRDDTSFAGWVTSDPVANADIVRHRAALLLNDLELLTKVGSAVEAAIATGVASLGDYKLESLIDIGATPPPDPSRIRERLRATAPIAPDALEAAIDDLYEQAGGVPTKPIDAAELEGLGRLFSAVNLLSSVVLSSELVPDMPRRRTLLMKAINGWAATSIVLLKQEQEIGGIAELITRTFLKNVHESERDKRLEKAVRVTVMLYLIIFVVGSLGNRRVDPLLPEVLEDADFMTNSIHALLAVVLAYHRRSPGWHRRLIELYEKHGSHNFVRDLVEVLALARYQSTLVTEQERRDLERFLLDFHTSGTDVSGVQRRQAVRSQVLADLRKSRIRASLRPGSPELLLDDPDDVDLEAGAGTSSSA
jgi:hypothetical protein